MKPAGLKFSPIREDVNEEMEIKNELTMSGNVKTGLFGEILTKVINTAWQNRHMRKRTQQRTDFQII